MFFSTESRCVEQFSSFKITRHLLYTPLFLCINDTFQHWRIIESLTLEKTSKIIKSNCQSNTTMPTKSYREVP